MNIIEVIQQPWPWYVAGPLIGLFMIFLLLIGKQFGMSSNLRSMCSMGGAGTFAPFFSIDWKERSWNLLIAVGAMIGGFIASHYLNENTVAISAKTVEDLNNLGIDSAGEAFLPTEIFSNQNILTIKNLLILLIGGFLVGFGARYAGGCTSGHGISGLSNLQWPSLLAIIGFFIGGLVMTHFLLPLILPL